MKKDFSSGNCLFPLLHQPSKPTWKKRVSSYLITKLCFGGNKAIAVLLFWQFSTGILYNLFLKPSAYLQISNDRNVPIVASLMATLFLVLTPLASLVADVKFGRFKTLLWSTYFMLASSGGTLLGGILLIYTVSDFGYYFYCTFSFTCATMLIYLCARIFFIANILQFGTDQLRDMPTRKSTIFLLAYYWCDIFSDLLCLSTNIPGHEMAVSPERKVRQFDKLKTIQCAILISASIMLSVVVIFIACKKKHWFVMDNFRKNPYRLVYNVLKFAIQHNKPVRRSAFTYCENKLPSRLDFSKKRYGGLFTTEEVEDVKVLINMLVVFLFVGPAFFMDLCATRLISQHPNHTVADYFMDSPVKVFFFNYGILSPLLMVFGIPLVAKVFFSKYFPNMFKRMWLSIMLLCILYSLYIMNYVIGSSHNFLEEFGVACFTNDSYSILHTAIVPSFSRTYIVAVQNVISSMYHIFLYISLWEFICCQCPQHMKGLLFALFYAVRAFYRFLAAVVLFLLFHFLKSQVIGCLFAFYAVNLIIGLLSLVAFAIVAYKYQYRKRDDICNVYQYAEDYYSKTGGYSSINRTVHD